jgi:hypothetical protein
MLSPDYIKNFGCGRRLLRESLDRQTSAQELQFARTFIQ